MNTTVIWLPPPQKPAPRRQTPMNAISTGGSWTFLRCLRTPAPEEEPPVPMLRRTPQNAVSTGGSWLAGWRRPAVVEEQPPDLLPRVFQPWVGVVAPAAPAWTPPARRPPPAADEDAAGARTLLTPWVAINVPGVWFPKRLWTPAPDEEAPVPRACFVVATIPPAASGPWYPRRLWTAAPEEEAATPRACQTPVVVSPMGGVWYPKSPRPGPPEEEPPGPRVCSAVATVPFTGAWQPRRLWTPAPEEEPPVPRLCSNPAAVSRAMSKRTIIVLTAANRPTGNTAAASRVDSGGGGGDAFRVGLSATGLAPATHFWLDWDMTATDDASIRAALASLVSGGTCWIYDGAVTTPQQVLTALGLSPCGDWAN